MWRIELEDKSGDKYILVWTKYGRNKNQNSRALQCCWISTRKVPLKASSIAPQGCMKSIMLKTVGLMRNGSWKFSHYSPSKYIKCPLSEHLHKINLHETLYFLLLPKMTREPAVSIPPYWNHEGSTPKADKHHVSHSGGKLNNRWLCFPCLAAHINLRSE